MSQQAVSKALALVAGLALSTALLSCSTDDAPARQPVVGEVSMALRLSSTVQAISIAYKISGGTLPSPIVGTVDVSDPGATVTFFVGGIPAGTGYVVDVSAKSTDGKTMCAGSSTFAVEAGGTTSVSLLLQCRADIIVGSVAVTGGTNSCPVIQSFWAGLQTTSVGGKISVAASASDLDAGDVVALSWSSATGGSFDSSTSGQTKFTCTSGGAKTLTITAFDGKCATTASVDVSCISFTCGNGVLDPGEQCDWPGLIRDGVPCTTECRFISECGDGFKNLGEDCDPPNVGAFGNTCSFACKTIPIVCGNGLIQPGEVCDGGPSCSSECQIDDSGLFYCGDSHVTPNEECDDGPQGSATCTDTCKRRTDACSACEFESCDQSTAGCQLYSGARKTLCLAWLNCMRGPKGANCSSSGTDPQRCYCGTKSDSKCLAGNGNGLCKAEAEAAAEVEPCTSGEDPDDCKERRTTELAARFRNPKYPIGGGTNALLCDGLACETKCLGTATPGVCGDGVIRAGEQCDPPNAGAGLANTCSNTCQAIPVVCGNGLIQPGEQCDPPQSPVAGGLCTSLCKLPLIPGPCGDHVVDIGEECDDGPGGSATCTPVCTSILGGCEACETAICKAQTDGCQLYSGSRRALCEVWVNCVRGANCSSRGQSPDLCICGTASLDACVAGDGNGVCKAEAEAASETAPCGANETAIACKTRRGNDVAERFRNPAYPIGGGSNLLLCLGESCALDCLR